MSTHEDALRLNRAILQWQQAEEELASFYDTGWRGEDRIELEDVVRDAKRELRRAFEKCTGHPFDEEPGEMDDEHG